MNTLRQFSGVNIFNGKVSCIFATFISSRHSTGTNLESSSGLIVASIHVGQTHVSL